jgi:hypothetical protein
MEANMSGITAIIMTMMIKLDPSRVHTEGVGTELGKVSQNKRLPPRPLSLVLGIFLSIPSGCDPAASPRAWF